MMYFYTFLFFKKHKFESLFALCELNEEDMRDWPIAVGEKKQIMFAVNQLKKKLQDRGTITDFHKLFSESDASLSRINKYSELEGATQEERKKYFVLLYS